MKHGLYNRKLDGKLNHICWDKEIVKAVHPQLLSNCKTNDTSKVSIVTIEAHVLSDNRLQQCQRHQTDIRTFEQPFPTARSTSLDRSRKSLPKLALHSNYKSCSILDMQQMLEVWYGKPHLPLPRGEEMLKGIGLLKF